MICLYLQKKGSKSSKANRKRMINDLSNMIRGNSMPQAAVQLASRHGRALNRNSQVSSLRIFVRLISL
jgi:hypothetical protein